MTTTSNGRSMFYMATSTKQRVTLFLNPELLKHSKAQAILDGRTLTELVEIALLEYLPSETILKKPQLSKK